jgi:predicted flap endonuclease-1-like 5' DNA nuclease
MPRAAPPPRPPPLPGAKSSPGAPIPPSKSSPGFTRSELPGSKSSPGFTAGELPGSKSSPGLTRPELPGSKSSPGFTAGELPGSKSSPGFTRGEVAGSKTGMPLRSTTPSSPPLPPLKTSPGSVPPSRMPRPSDPPPAARAASEPNALQRQRLAQMETQLDQARSTIARQKNEIEELRSKIEAGDVKLGEILAGLRDDGRTQALEKRLAELETERVSYADDLKKKVLEAAEEGSEAQTERLSAMETRLRVLEEGTENARIRMRLERVGHRLEELDRRLAGIEETQRTSSAADKHREEGDRKRDARLARIESLFEELADELKKQREPVDLDAVRARMDDIEDLVLRVAGQKKSVFPGAGADDLTQIKGIGPKTAGMLRAMGVTTFAQIAGWTEEEMARAAEQLGIPVARIKKGKWPETAARLAG